MNFLKANKSIEIIQYFFLSNKIQDLIVSTDLKNETINDILILVQFYLNKKNTFYNTDIQIFKTIFKIIVILLSKSIRIFSNIVKKENEKSILDTNIQEIKDNKVYESYQNEKSTSEEKSIIFKSIQIINKLLFDKEKNFDQNEFKVKIDFNGNLINFLRNELKQLFQKDRQLDDDNYEFLIFTFITEYEGTKLIKKTINSNIQEQNLRRLNTFDFLEDSRKIKYINEIFDDYKGNYISEYIKLVEYIKLNKIYPDNALNFENNIELLAVSSLQSDKKIKSKIKKSQTEKSKIKLEHKTSTIKKVDFSENKLKSEAEKYLEDFLND